MADEVTDPVAGGDPAAPVCPSCGSMNAPGASACTSCGTLMEAPPTAVVVTVDLRPGSLFHSRYEILGPLGRGGMGMVYKARDRTLDEVVAIKVLRPDFAQDPRMTERFKSEIKLARKVRHRNVCTIHDYGEDRGLLYISMELIEGVDLKRVLREKGGLPPDEAYSLAIEVAEGLQAVHDAGIIHRDLKTPNIMRDAQGIARLMDFGIAKRQGGDTLTATGHIVGTPEYMSPEQAQGHKVDFRSDVYALGIVVYEIFTGSVPFRGETPISTILKHLHDPPPLEGPSASRLPDALKSVLRKALEKDPAHRFASARDLADALREARSPSRRQQPISTDVLRAPTLTEGPSLNEAEEPKRSKRARAPRGAQASDSIATRATLPMSGPGRKLQPWLLVVPALAVAGGALVMRETVFKTASAPVTAGPAPTLLADATPAPPSLGSAVTAPPAAALPPATAAPEPTPSPAAVRTAAAPPPRVEPRQRARPAEPTPPPQPSASPRLSAAAPTAAPSPVALTPAPVPAATLAPAPTAEATGAGSLQVVAKPWGNVIVDGRTIGSTPLDKIALPAGSHTVRVSHPAYEPWERRVVIRDGQTERVVVDFPADGVKRQ